MPDTVPLLLSHLANGLAAKILRSRQERKLEALSLIEFGELGVPVETLFERAAKQLKRLLKAELCVVYKLERTLQLKAVAASPDHVRRDMLVANADSVYHRVLRGKGPVRTADFADCAERQRVFGTEQYDDTLLREETRFLKNEKLRSFIAAPVIVTGHGAAVVVLMNKVHDPKSWHLTKEFSNTDADVLEAVCESLAAVIPSTEIYRVMGEMSRVLYAGALREPSTREAVFNVLANLIPGTATAELAWQSPQPGLREPIHLGGEPWFDDTHRPKQPTPPGKVLPLMSRPATQNQELRFYVAERIPHIDGAHSRLLAVGLRRDSLSPFEEHVLSFLCKGISQAIRGEADLTREIEDVVQIRHVLRSAMTGVIGYLDTAVRNFAIFKQQKYAPFVLDDSAFEDDLVWANFFATKLQNLMEQSRFLITEITRDKLRRGSHSPVGLVDQVVRCIQPFAKLRRIKLIFANKIPETDAQVSFDHQLVDMMAYNIIDNAIKYSHRSRPVYVDLFLDRDDWKLRVTDFGVYIKPEDREVIFMPFERRPSGDDAIARPGTGIGLSVARAVARAHGGDVTCDSELQDDSPVARTRFFVRMPRQLK